VASCPVGISPVTVRVRKNSLILRNVADAVAEADGKRTKGIGSTYSLISESLPDADDGRGPLITYKWNSGLRVIQHYSSRNIGTTQLENAEKLKLNIPQAQQ
jgi:hypothetical protein